MKYLCKIGLHKWGIVKQWLVEGVYQPAQRCLRCGSVRKAK